MTPLKPSDTALPGWMPPARPGALELSGRHVRLEPLRAKTHAAELFEALRGDPSLWDYMPYGPFDTATQYHDWVLAREASTDPLFLALRNLATGKAEGVASYLRITPEAGSIEVGHICLSPALQRSVAATEAMALMMDWAFSAGYRRYEWKCNALNLRSRRAAARLGFSYEGVFRNHMVIKGRNRDSAWFSVIDSEWPALKAAFAEWLDPANFDAAGVQRTPLSELTARLCAAQDPGLPAE
jgi:RimJ/RimL family protein N-acetyltransferase